MPLISICIPVYNHGDLIGAAIRSVLNQDVTDFELIIMDNHSTDKTREVVESFNDPRMRYFCNPENIGFSRNLQRGLEMATGKFLLFLCADDFLYEGYLKKTKGLFDEYPGLAFVHTGHDLVNTANQKGASRIYPWEKILSAEIFLARLAEWDFTGICLSSVLFQREKLLKMGGVDTELEFAADYGMWLKLCAEGDVGYIPESLVGYREHPGQCTKVFMPGLKYRLIEKFLERAKKHQLSKEMQQMLFQKAVVTGFRELPHSRMKGVSMKSILGSANQLFKSSAINFSIFVCFFYFMISMLPVAVLKILYHLRRVSYENSAH